MSIKTTGAEIAYQQLVAAPEAKACSIHRALQMIAEDDV